MITKTMPTDCAGAFTEMGNIMATMPEHKLSVPRQTSVQSLSHLSMCAFAFFKANSYSAMACLLKQLKFHY